MALECDFKLRTAVPFNCGPSASGAVCTNYFIKKIYPNKLLPFSSTISCIMAHRFSRSDSRLLVEIPWYTEVIIGQETLKDVDLVVCFRFFLQGPVLKTGSWLAF